MCVSNVQHSVPINGALVPIYGAPVRQFSSGPPRRPGGDGSPLSFPLRRRRQHQLLPCRGRRNPRKVPIRCHPVPISAILDLPTIKGQAFWDGLGFVLQMLGLFGWICDVEVSWGWIRICVADVDDGLRLIKVRFKADSGAMERLRMFFKK